MDSSLDSEISEKPEEPTLKEKTAKGFFWGGISNGVQQLLGIVFGIYLARTLNADDYGLVGMLSIFLAIANIIINSGFSIALTNNLEAKHKDYNAVFWFSFCVGLIIYIILYFCSPLIATFYDRSELINLSRVVFINFFFSGIAVAPYTVMFKKLMVKQLALIDIASISLSGIIGVSLTMFGFTYWALAIQSVVYAVSGACLRYIFSPWKPTLTIDFSPLKKMFPFSFNLLLTSLFQQIHANFFSVLLGKFYNATQLGYYYQGNKWMSMGNQLITGMVNMVAQPVIVQVNNDKERQLRIFRKMIRFAAFVAFPAFAGLAFVAYEFIIVTIGEKWLPSVTYLQILCIWGSIAPFILLYSQLLLSHSKSSIYLKGNIIIGSFQMVIIFILFMLKFPINYLVVFFVISYCFSLFYWHYFVNKIISIKILDLFKDIAPYISVTLISILITHIMLSKVDNIYILLIGKVLITIILYIAILWFSKSVILRESIKMVIKK